jgi:DNA-binding response OmpR family regulator
VAAVSLLSALAKSTPTSGQARAMKRVLLVEDEPLIAALTVDSLNELGFDAIEASTAKAALDIAQKQIADIELAIVDLGLPDRAGDELVSDLRALRPDLPIIVATGYDARVAQAKLQGKEGLVFLGKPYDFNALATAIKSLGLLTA